MATLQDSFTTASPDYQRQIYGVNNYAGQGFIPTEDYHITKVRLFAYKTGTPGTITVTIEGLSGGLPSGVALATGTINGTTLTSDTAGGWVEISLGAGADLTSGTTYVIVVKNSDTSSGNAIWWRALLAGGYTGPAYNWNGTWNDFGARDFLFETYDNIDAFDEGTKNVDGVATVALTVEEQTDKSVFSKTGWGWNMSMGI